MNNNVKKPCNDCPFRKASLAGWLGASTPHQFISTTMADHPMPCHLTVDYSDPAWKAKLDTSGASYCAGALTFFANIFKLSRDLDRPRMPRSDAVFASPQEFLDHHETYGKRGSAHMEDDE